MKRKESRKVSLRLKKNKKANSPAKRRLLRAKRSEREAARNLLRIDGEPGEKELKALMSSTGRVGEYYGLQVDCVSKNYCAEVKSTIKNSLRVEKGIINKIKEGAKKFNKEWLLILKFHNLEIHCISKERHEELLEAERRIP